MSGLVLHSFRRCPYAIRARMVLEEKGLKYALIEEDLANPSSELLRIRPSGQVPVLIHEGQVIPESAVITEYLEETFPEPALMPKTPGGRAQVRLWTHWCEESLKPDLDAFKYEGKDMRVRLGEHLAKLDAPLAKGAFLLGEEFTLADVHLFPFYRQLKRARPNEPGVLQFPPRADAWLERIMARPSFARVMA